MKRTIMQRLLAFLFLLLPTVVNASIETDKNVGLCVNYLILIQKSNAANIALRQADNQSRAMQFARTEMNEIKRMSTSGNWDSAAQKVYAIKGDGACRKIGVRPGDYKN